LSGLKSGKDKSQGPESKFAHSIWVLLEHPGADFHRALSHLPTRLATISLGPRSGA
jgi:hypothetical protein